MRDRPSLGDVPNRKVARAWFTTLRRWCRFVLPLAVACNAAEQRDEVVVFAAASLTESFTELAEVVEQQHPGVEVRLNFAGSQQLAVQLEQGASADLFASANREWITYLSERGLVSEPVAFARTDMALLATSPMRFDDIVRRGTQIVVGAESVPVGHYTRMLLDRLEQSPQYGAEFVEAVRANIVSEEDNVRSVLGKVLLGEADVAFIYRSELMHIQRGGVYAVPVPPGVNVSAIYYVAHVTSSQRSARAAIFAETLRAEPGRLILQKWGLHGNP